MKRNLLTLIALVAIGTAQAQTVEWNREKFPDWNPTPRIDQRGMQKMQQRLHIRKAAGQTRPDHWNNAQSSAFPPVMNQSAGSCGSASRIYYMFSHEINAARGVSGKLSENIYPTHFTWLLTWTPGGQGKEVLAQHNGIPNSDVYGGYTYSELFGYQDCDDGQSNYGWMQGYDKWFHAMHNRISSSANFPYSLKTEEGRELVKNYLWNHCGDETYSTGGIVGVGVASGGDWRMIPKTDVNDALGVSGQYYVHKWGTSVDHALTIVGYDDRIQFDLDGNGIYGEEDKDEVGAWIIVNSWGSWCNGGFIYCPYAEARPTATDTGYWMPEYYTIRRNYRPLRTLKVKMDYSHRSEIALYVGVASDPNATAPERETWLRHFYYSGLGKGVTVNSANPDPAIPMLGKWADGELHTEPMEFGYDLTDLTEGFDTSKPLKYFFRVEPRAWAAGSGTIYAASIVDYTLDREGVETPFDLGEGTPIANAGTHTTITTLARGENIPAPRNLSIAEGTLAWEAPAGTGYEVDTYNIYKDNEYIASVDGQTLTTALDGDGTYSVSAVYHIHGYDIESTRSAAIINADAGKLSNTFLYLSKGGQFTVPAFTSGTQSEYTIEFWLYPRQLSGEMFGIKASSGKFFFKTDANKHIQVGFDGGDYTTSSRTLSIFKWQHIAITVNGTNIRVYVNGISWINWRSGWSNSGINGANDLWFGKTEGTTSQNKQIYDANWNGYVDELRIWNHERTAAEIQATYKDTYALPLLQNSLTHYYKMGIVENADGSKALKDDLLRHDAPIGTPDLAEETVIAEEEFGSTLNPLKDMTASADFTLDTDAPIVGQPVTLIDASSPSTTQWQWTFDGAKPATSSVCRPVVVFTEAGEHEITLTATNLKGESAEKTLNVTVNEAQLPEPDFIVPEGVLRAGEHITFINTTPNADNCTFQWTFEGAENEEARTTNAAATFNTYGHYVITLIASNAAGEAAIKKAVSISKVAPEASFKIHNNVALIGEKVYLEDASKYDPSTWQWSVTNAATTLIVDGQNTSLTLDAPGIYDVSLKAANEVGSNSANRARAITVCNADGQTGLKFSADAANKVTAPSPFETAPASFSISWWMYPGTLTEACCGMGDSKSTFWLQVDAAGAMTLFKNGNTTKTVDGFVIDNEWHHYAITYSYSKFTYYRDGEEIGNFSLSGSHPTWNQFRIGGEEAPMNAIIDELSVWKTQLTKNNLRRFANAPIDSPTEQSLLMLYYDFNQSSGDVEDKTGHGLTGVRTGFGPDGDAWTDSKGIFFLNFTTVTATDITARYLKNYKAPFAATSRFINGTGRFKQLATETTTSPWVQENATEDNGITTEWHVDINKGSYLTLTTQWDNFASEVKNLKLYQTVTLPEGAYEFTATRGSWEWNPAGKYLVVAEGTGLPDQAKLSAEALAYAACGNTCSFVLTEETTVSLGLVSNQSGLTCHTIQAFALKRKGFTRIDADNAVGIADMAHESAAATKLQATGGLGCIKIATSEPQVVDVFDLAGRLVYSQLIDGQATVPARRGIYVIGRQKVMVR